jgi:ABC-type antimicrobial peptide transport system permease subunit
MISNYYKIAWRSIVKNKASSIINIGGLAVGMSVAMLIALWIWDEVTFDSYHANHKQLAQVMSISFNEKNEAGTGSAVAMPLGNELRTKFAGDFKDVSMTSWNYDHVMTVGDKKITGNGMWVESSFPAMFSLKMIEGNSKALDDPSSVLLSASIAKALFGNANPINKTVNFDNKFDFKVAGVFEDLPHNTTLRETKLLLPWKKYVTTESWLTTAQTQWNNHSFQAFVQVNDKSSFDKISEKAKNVVMAHKNAATEGKEELLLHPMDKWHLYSDFENGIATGGRIQFIWLFGIIGIFILMLACINFMNLSTARSEKRAKEVGIRKAIGSLKAQLIGQFMTESVLVALISFVLSLLLVLLLMPMFNNMADKAIELPWNNLIFWILAILFTLFTGVISGSYPAFYLSGFEPIKVLKGTFRVGKFASIPRKVLVVVQFTFSIALIIGSVIVFKQIQYAKNRPVNYKSTGLITIRMSTPDLYGHYDAVRNDLLSTGVVNNMAESNSPTTKVSSNNIGFNWQGKDPHTLAGFGTIAVSPDFGQTIGWKIQEGRDFSKELATDDLAVILNESAVKQIGMNKSIIGQTIQYRDKNYTVVGVIKDMVMESPYNPIRPTVFFNDLNSSNTITISIKEEIPVQDALSKIELVFKKYNAPFDYTFNDETYQKKFAAEQRIGNLAAFFTILAIFISCLGLFGLASFVAEQRTKEIGVRKVLGASVLNLWGLLSRDFLLLILISSLIAIPVSYYFLHEWLQKYEYRTEISISVFLIAISGSALVTLLTVSFQTVKAAIANPVKSLRGE